MLISEEFFFVSPLSVRQAKFVLELREYLTRLSKNLFFQDHVRL